MILLQLPCAFFHALNCALLCKLILLVNLTVLVSARLSLFSFEIYNLWIEEVFGLFVVLTFQLRSFRLCIWLVTPMEPVVEAIATCDIDSILPQVHVIAAQIVTRVSQLSAFLDDYRLLEDDYIDALV